MYIGLLLIIMFNTLEQLYNFYNFNLDDLNQNINYEKEILDIFNNKNIELYINDKNLCCWIGKYYFEEKDYHESVKYYLMAIEKSDSTAMNNLGYYYQFIKKDYDNMKKYFLMAINKGYSDAMTNLGYYYEEIEKNYQESVKYYLMAIEKGNSAAMNNLGNYYFEEKDYDNMKKYYLMAINKGDLDAMINLAIYYEEIEKDYDNMKKYYLMAVNKGHLDAMNYLKNITSPLERYILYKQNNISFDEKLTKDIHIYNNKLKMSKINSCGICLENNKRCILLNCFFHYICTDCYIQLYDKPCSFCEL